jgi:hypothetical protein
MSSTVSFGVPLGTSLGRIIQPMVSHKFKVVFTTCAGEELEYLSLALAKVSRPSSRKTTLIGNQSSPCWLVNQEAQNAIKLLGKDFKIVISVLDGGQHLPLETWELSECNVVSIERSELSYSLTEPCTQTLTIEYAKVVQTT